MSLNVRDYHSDTTCPYFLNFRDCPDFGWNAQNKTNIVCCMWTVNYAYILIETIYERIGKANAISFLFFKLETFRFCFLLDSSLFWVPKQFLLKNSLPKSEASNKSFFFLIYGWMGFSPKVFFFSWESHLILTSEVEIFLKGAPSTLYGERCCPNNLQYQIPPFERTDTKVDLCFKTFSTFKLIQTLGNWASKRMVIVSFNHMIFCWR